MWTLLSLNLFLLLKGFVFNFQAVHVKNAWLKCVIICQGFGNLASRHLNYRPFTVYIFKMHLL